MLASKLIEAIQKQIDDFGDSDVFHFVSPISTTVLPVRGTDFTYLNRTNSRVASEQEYDEGDTRSAIVLVS